MNETTVVTLGDQKIRITLSVAEAVEVTWQNQHRQFNTMDAARAFVQGLVAAYGTHPGFVITSPNEQALDQYDQYLNRAARTAHDAMAEIMAATGQSMVEVAQDIAAMAELGDLVP